MKKIISLLLAVLFIISFAACTKNTDNSSSGNGNTEQEAVKLPDIVTGTMVFKDIGEVKFEIYPNVARQSCLNFIYLVNKGHYNGVIVDHLVKDFVIEAGDCESGYTRRKTDPDYTIKGEFSENGVENTLNVIKGAMAWVTTDGDNDSAHTEFSIYVKSETCWSVAGKAAVFGYVVGEDSFKVINKINKRKTYAGMPVKEIMISAVTLDPISQEGFAPDFEFPEPDFIIRDTAKSDEVKKD